MAGLAAQHAAQRHIAVVEARLMGERDGAGDFKCARNRHALPCRPCPLDGFDGATAQFVAELAIEAGLEDQQMGAHLFGGCGGLFGLHVGLYSVRRAT